MSAWLTAIDRGDQLALGAQNPRAAVWAGRIAGRYVFKSGKVYWSAPVSRASRDELAARLAPHDALATTWTRNTTAHDDPFDSASHVLCFDGVYREVDWARLASGNYRETVRVEHNYDPMGGAFIVTHERELDPVAAAAAFDAEMGSATRGCPFPRIEVRTPGG